jgi:hypothetical protein
LVLEETASTGPAIGRTNQITGNAMGLDGLELVLAVEDAFGEGDC